jgi:antitoxin (DNA-binding transcriptional repressor) of toxin-antitoxin stability system
MNVISMHQAKSTLSQLVKRAATGETILIGAYGKVDAQLGPPQIAVRKKKFGVMAGKLKVPADCDAPLLKETLDSFELPRKKVVLSN